MEEDNSELIEEASSLPPVKYECKNDKSYFCLDCFDTKHVLI